MAEATHNTDALLNGSASVGKGLKIYAGKVSIDDGQTIDTGMTSIISATLTPSSTGYNATVTSTSSGAITADVTQADGSTSASSETVYVIAVGYVD